MSRYRGSIAAGAVILLACALGDAPKAAPSRKVWDFGMTPIQMTPPGFRVAAGEWRVVDDAENRVLAQEAKNPDEMFNVILVGGTTYKDLDISVRLKAVHGALDQGGGLVWRARDARNYYIARFNPLENNVRVYKVVDGKRTMFQSADVTLGPGWHALHVTMTGGSIKCELDGKPYLDVTDGTFKDAGMIGLWSKSDAQTFFDDLTVEPGRAD
jgi:hypothetical protein